MYREHVYSAYRLIEAVTYISKRTASYCQLVFWLATKASTRLRDGWGQRIKREKDGCSYVLITHYSGRIIVMEDVLGN